MIFHAVGRSWSSIFIKLVLALAADSFGLRDVFDVRPGSYLTNSFPGVSGGNCDEFVHDLEPTIPKIQRILAEFEAVTNDENFAHMPIHVKSSINNYWLDPRQRFSKKPLVLGQVTARWDRLKVIVSGLSDFFNGRSLSTFRPLLKCNDRYLRWTEYYMYPDGSASNVLVNMSASTPDGVWGMYWVDDQAKYGGFARQPADPSKIDITFHGKWPPKNRPGGMWGGPCDLGSPPAQAIFTEVAPGVHNGHVLHLCRETNPDPNIIWMSEFPQGVRLDDLRRKHDQQQPHRQGDWIDPQIFEDWSWIIIHETLHLLSEMYDNEYSKPRPDNQQLNAGNFENVNWVPKFYPDGTPTRVYSAMRCLMFALEKPGPTPDNKDAMHNVNNVLYILMATYYRQFDLSGGKVEEAPDVMEGVIVGK